MAKTFPSTILATILILACAPATYGQGAVAVGDEFQVNTYVSDGQRSPSLATLPGGDFVVVWVSPGSPGSDSDDSSIQGQRYDAGGAPLGAQFQVNSYTTDEQLAPEVAALTDGGFAVTWFNSSFDSDIQLQRFAPGGAAVGPQVQVNTETHHSQSIPAVAGLANGGLVVTWRSWGSPGSDSSQDSIQGQRYAADGTAAGGQFQVNSYTTDDQVSPAVATLAGGDFVVVWDSRGSSGSDSSGASVQGQRYTQGGNPVGAEFQVNSYTHDWQYDSSVAALADGGFVVAWQSRASNGSDISYTSIRGRRFAADGTGRGPDFQVNSLTSGVQTSPAVTATAGGGFVALWDSYGLNATDPAAGFTVQSQRFAADGRALGGELQLSSEANGHQREPAAAALPGGGFAVAWEDWVAYGSAASRIQGRRFEDPRYSLVGLGGKCLDVEAEDPTSGTPVNLYTCHGGENQRWQLELSSTPQRIVGLGGKCLIPGPGDRVVIGECGGAGDLWQLDTPGHGEPSLLVHVDSDLCVDVEGAVPDDGTPTQLFACHGGANQLWRPAAEVCTADSLGLCLESERFRVDLAWRSFDGTTGSGQAVPFGSDDSGLLWFFEADNWEMLIKVLDACHVNDRLWVFAAATTTVEYTLTVTDTALGTIREYFNPLGNASAAITDTGAFTGCSVSAGSAAGSATSPEALLPLHPSGVAEPIVNRSDFELKGACVPSLTRMCLSDNRFSVEIEWGDYAGNAGSGQVVGADSPDSGLFWFFNSSNWEMLIKVLDACDVNGRFWMLAAATTDVEYTLRVTDTESGFFREYFNPLATAAPALVDTFETCP